MAISRQRVATAGGGIDRAGELEARALAALEARDPGAAVDYYRQAVALCPLNPALRSALGDALLALAEAKGPRTSRASGIPLPDEVDPDDGQPGPMPRRPVATGLPPRRGVAPVGASPRAAAPPVSSSSPAPSTARPMSSRIRGLFAGDEEQDDSRSVATAPPAAPPRAVPPPMAPRSAPMEPRRGSVSGRVAAPPMTLTEQPSLARLTRPPASTARPVPVAPVSPRVLRRESGVSGRFLMVALLITGVLLVLAGVVSGTLMSLMRESALPSASLANLPADVTAALEQAQADLGDRRPEKAIAALDEAAAKYPGNEVWFADALGRAWRAKGNSHRLAGEFDKAIASFEKAADLDPKSADNWIDLAKARESSASRLVARDKAAAKRLREGVAAAYAKATEAAPDSAVAWFGLGEARAALGDRGAAVEAWRKAQRLAPDLAIAKAARERLEQPSS